MGGAQRAVKSGESPFVTGLRCLRCRTHYAPGAVDYVCDCRPNRGSDLGTLDVQYDYQAVSHAVTPDALRADPDRSIGRFWPLLPIRHRHSLPPLPVGGTPLLAAPRLRAETGLSNLWIKDDGRNPSASFKDRASAIAVARAQSEGRPIVATASTGNAAAALAGQAAAAGQQTIIFVPKSAPPAKIAQLLVYGSTVLAVDGSYDDAFDLCTEACLEFGWYNRSTGYNPYMTEGKKTVAYEIALQLAEQSGADTAMVAPDALFVSVGDGCIIGGVHKGFKDLLALGWIDHMPRIYGVQSTLSPALYNA
ncbi:MAG: pyridoxal-phosphate dependent enzyme, partial [Caldilinea sp.]